MSSSEWKEVKLGDCINIKHGYAFKGEFFSETETSDVLVTPGNFKVGGGFKEGKLKFYRGEYPKEYILNPNDVIITMTDLSKMGDTLGYSALVPYNAKIRYLHNQRIGLVEFISQEVWPSFMYWRLRDYDYQNFIVGSASGTTVKHTSPTTIKSFRFVLPPLGEQKTIAATLSCLDDKIELNNRINKTLEQMAQAIFKSWFVDFEPFQDGEFEDSELGKIPKRWRIGTIGDYVKVKSGYAFKSVWWEPIGVPVIKIKEIDNGTINYNDISFVSEDKAKLANEFIVNGGDLLIAMTGATIGKFAIVPQMNSFAVVNQRVGKFFLGDDPVKKLGFIYCNLKQDEIYDQIVSRGDGSAQPNISPSGIESIKIVLPPVNIINNFNRLTEKSFENLIENISQNAKLSNIRDSLLPKLMSGEIRVPIEEVQ